MKTSTALILLGVLILGSVIIVSASPKNNLLGLNPNLPPPPQGYHRDANGNLVPDYIPPGGAGNGPGSAVRIESCSLQYGMQLEQAIAAGHWDEAARIGSLINDCVQRP